MSTTTDNQIRAEFLKKNSPLANTDTDKVDAPPIFPTKNAGGIFNENLEGKHTETGKMKFWENWNTNHYAGISVALGVFLIIAVVWSYASVDFTNPSLQATLTSEQETSVEDIRPEPSTNRVVSDEIVIEEDVVSSAKLLEELTQENTPQITDVEEYDSFLNSYGL